MNKHEQYKLSVVSKYLSEGVNIDTPALLKYKETKSRDDLFNLLNEYLEDSAFLSVTILDRILSNILDIQDTTEDNDRFMLCQFYFESLCDLRDAKYEQLEDSLWRDEVLSPLLNKLGVYMKE